MKSRLDKRTFLAARECVNRGWFAHRDPQREPGFGEQWRFWVGHEVEKTARTWLGAGEVLRRSPVDAAVDATKAAVASRAHERLFEATFVADGCVARADAIECVDGEWTVLEIKSGKSKLDAVDKSYIDDLAFTVCVAIAAGLPVHRACLVLINGEYELDGPVDFFVRVDVTEDVMARAREFSLLAPGMASVVLAESAPPAMLNFACRNCDYYTTTCVGQGVDDPLWLIPRLSQKRFDQLKGYERISRVPAETELTEIQTRVFKVLRSGEPHIDAPVLAQLLRTVEWPAYYLDFETVSPALPWFPHTSPYQAMPFQYSLHVASRLGSAPTHHEFLAPLQGDWRRALLEQLIAELGGRGSVVVYSSYERTCLKALANWFPEYRDAIDGVIARMFDLEEVFKVAYAHPGFLGKTSIKKILPVMVDERELSYHNLPVNNGDDALGLFSLMRVGDIDEAFHTRFTDQLLEYCKLDTLAMVRLHEAVAHVL
ncbi:DUF2779 domain-containing protein [bacterium]|jgi:hypothetical protein|nr:DUF2779 domain-containing protein [bacterium]